MFARTALMRVCPIALYPLSTDHYLLRGLKSLAVKRMQITYYSSITCQEEIRNPMTLKNVPEGDARDRGQWSTQALNELNVDIDDGGSTCGSSASSSASAEGWLLVAGRLREAHLTQVRLGEVHVGLGGVPAGAQFFQHGFDFAVGQRGAWRRNSSSPAGSNTCTYELAPRL